MQHSIDQRFVSVLGMQNERRARPLGRLCQVMLSTALVGCVPTVAYEEAQSATEVAQEAGRRTELELASVRAELERLREQHREVTERLHRVDLEASQAAFDRLHVEKQRDEHAELTTQLRGELARLGDRLQSSTESGAELERRLEAAQAELERVERELEELRASAP